MDIYPRIAGWHVVCILDDFRPALGLDFTFRTIDFGV